MAAAGKGARMKKVKQRRSTPTARTTDKSAQNKDYAESVFEARQITGENFRRYRVFVGSLLIISWKEISRRLLNSNLKPLWIFQSYLLIVSWKPISRRFLNSSLKTLWMFQTFLLSVLFIAPLFPIPNATFWCPNHKEPPAGTVSKLISITKLRNNNFLSIFLQTS